MSRPDKVTVADVRASFNKKVVNHFSVRWFGRPIANLMTPMFYNSGWTADGVTVLRVLLAFVALGLLMSPWTYGPHAAGLLSVLCFIFDCLDGNLSRLHNNATFFGKFIDGIGDMVFLVLAPLATGIGIWLNGGDEIYLLLGGLVCCGALTSQFFRVRIMFFEEWMVRMSGPITDEEQARMAPANKVHGLLAQGWIFITLFAPLLLLLPNGPVIFLLTLTATQLPIDFAWTGVLTWKASRMLRRWRRSVHAAPAAPAQEQTPATDSGKPESEADVAKSAAGATGA